MVGQKSGPALAGPAAPATTALCRWDIPIGVSLYSTPMGTAYIEPLVESQKSTKTAKKGNTVLSEVSFNIYDMRTYHFNATNTLGCFYMPYFFKENTTHMSINRTYQTESRNK